MHKKQQTAFSYPQARFVFSAIESMAQRARKNKTAPSTLLLNVALMKNGFVCGFKTTVCNIIVHY